MRCSQSINSNAGYLDIGVVGGGLSSYGAGGVSGSPDPQSAIGYARIVVPLGAAPRRLDCTALYELEIRKLKQEIDLLKIGLQ